MSLSRILRTLSLRRQLSRDIEQNIKPARVANQKAAQEGVHTYWRNAGANARKLKAEGWL